MRLISCPSCHAQYDVGEVRAEKIACRCGHSLPNVPPLPVEADVRRCGSCGASVAPQATSCDYCGSAIVRDARRRRLICPECYGGNCDDARFCAVCGVAFRPEPLEADAPELPCPACGEPMAGDRIGPIAIQGCAACEGIWIPEDRFDELIRRVVEARRSHEGGAVPAPRPRFRGGQPTREAVRYRRCPVCGQFMHRRNWQRTSGVIVDRCWDHGSWLDADELEQIAGFVLSGGLGAGAAALQRELDAPRGPNPAEVFGRIRRESRELEPDDWLGSVLRFMEQWLTG